jgi:hypothetical protein
MNQQQYSLPPRNSPQLTPPRPSQLAQLAQLAPPIILRGEEYKKAKKIEEDLQIAEDNTKITHAKKRDITEQREQRKQTVKKLLEPRFLILLIIIIGIYITIPSIIISFYNSNDNDILSTSTDYDKYSEKKYIDNKIYIMAIVCIIIILVCIIVSYLLIIFNINRYVIYFFIGLCIFVHLSLTLGLSIITQTLIGKNKLPSSYSFIWAFFILEILIPIFIVSSINK